MPYIMILLYLFKQADLLGIKGFFKWPNQNLFSK